MFSVYVLKDRDGKLYKGMTNNLSRRVEEHKDGRTRTTKKMKDVQVIYTETYDTRIEARAREKYLKSAAGRRFLKKVLSK